MKSGGEQEGGKMDVVCGKMGGGCGCRVWKDEWRAVDGECGRMDVVC